MTADSTGQSCGYRLDDDFIELRPGALKDLETCLNQNNKVRAHTNVNSYSNASGGWSISTLQSLAVTSYRNLIRRSRPPPDPNDRLPVHNSPDSQSASNAGKSPTLKDTLYLLLCIKSGRYGTELHHQNVADINSDRSLFLQLQEYFSQRQSKLRSALSMRTVKSIDLVKVRSWATAFSISRFLVRQQALCSLFVPL